MFLLQNDYPLKNPEYKKTLNGVKWWVWQDSNLRPLRCQRNALTT